MVKNIKKISSVLVVSTVILLGITSCGSSSSSSKEESEVITTPNESSTGLEKGEALYRANSCAGCHGAKGEMRGLGVSDIIQGQEKEGTIVQLQGYRDGTRDVHGSGSIMKGVVENLSDSEIENLAIYVESLAQ